MKVKEILEKLKGYNPEAEFCIVVNGSNTEFEICTGGSEGATSRTCDSVDFMINTSSENKVDVANNMIKTRFDDFKEKLTPERLASAMVKLVLINNSEPYYITTSGQLFPMSSEGFDAAINFELEFWESEKRNKEDN